MSLVSGLLNLGWPVVINQTPMKSISKVIIICCLTLQAAGAQDWERKAIR